MCWGRNNAGQIGDGTGTNRLNPVPVNTTESFISITAGLYQTCGLLENQSMMCWGGNDYGQIGDGTSGTNRLNPVFVNTTESFISITGGGDHTCGLLSNGSMMCWGRNHVGQIGDGTSGTNRLNPVFVNTTESFFSMTRWGYHTCGILINRSVMCWGLNGDGQIGNGSSGGNVLNPIFVNSTKSFVSITTGAFHTCGLLENQSMMCWGRNDDGQIGDGTSGTDRLNPIFINTTETMESPVIGNATDVASGSDATTTWAGLDEERTYLWSATVGDGYLLRNSVIWKFTTAICAYSGSGDWNVNCAGKCIITTNENLPENTLNLYGTGTFTILANITTNKVIKENTCQMINKINDGNRLIIKLG